MIGANLKRTVTVLSRDIGSRSYSDQSALDKTVDYICAELQSYGCEVSIQQYDSRGRMYRNVSAVMQGRSRPEKLLVIGAHYDTVDGTPGADDNASGVAGVLELARLHAHTSPGISIHFVFFTLEEPPFFRTKQMGSYVYAQALYEARRDVAGMICLESIGYFSDEPGTQMYPLPFFRFLYPSSGNFITFVGNLASREFMKHAERAFKKTTDLPIETLASPSVIPGVDFSDHRSFWKFGYRAIMVTDTAFYRNPQYHGMGDVPEILDYGGMTKVVTGLHGVVEEMAG